VYKDLREVREHYAAIRDLISANPGGGEDVVTLGNVSVLCEAAIAALQDPECRQQLRLVDQHAAQLFSSEEHRKWDRPNMTGADYLRLQILIALESVHTRLLFLSARRDRDTPHLAHRTGPT
jgi:hypothetical protein